MSVTDINKIPNINGELPAAQKSPVYEQLTLSDWLEMKEKLRLELQNVTQSFVRIGYALRKIDDERMYEADGFKSIAEFAKKEYGLEASTVSRLIAINREYSVDGYSERLREEYIGYGQSKLSEMLQLPEEYRELITPQTQRSDIRELKKALSTEPESGEADDIRSLIESYFRMNKQDLNDLYGMAENNHVDDGHIVSMDLRAVIDLLNPSGNKAFKKGKYMLFLYEEDVKFLNLAGGKPVTHTWGDFLAAVDEIFGPAANGYQTWERYFGEEEPEEEIAPAQKEGSMSNDQEVDDGRTEGTKAAKGRRAGTEEEREESQAGGEGETQGRDRKDRSEDSEMGAGGGDRADISAESGVTDRNCQKTEVHDGRENGACVSDRDEQGRDACISGAGDEPGRTQGDDKGIAPAQKSEPDGQTEEPEVDTKYSVGDTILIRAAVDMITTGSGKVNYRIRTESGKTIWITEEDIAEENV